MLRHEPGHMDLAEKSKMLRHGSGDMDLAEDPEIHMDAYMRIRRHGFCRRSILVDAET